MELTVVLKHTYVDSYYANQLTPFFTFDHNFPVFCENNRYAGRRDFDKDSAKFLTK